MQRLWYAILFLVLFPLSGWSQSGWAFFVQGGGLLSNSSGADAVRHTFLNPRFMPNDAFDGYYANDRAGSLFYTGGSGGIGIEKSWGKRLNLQLALNLFSVGSKLNTKYTPPQVWVGPDIPSPPPDSLRWHGQTTFSIVYLKFPFTLQYYPVKETPFFISGGFYYANKLKETEKGYLVNKASGKETHYHHPNDHYKKADLGYTLGAGYDFTMAGGHFLRLSGHYSRSILTVNSRMTPNTPEFYNQTFSLGVAYGFQL